MLKRRSIVGRNRGGKGGELCDDWEQSFSLTTLTGNVLTEEMGKVLLVKFQKCTKLRSEFLTF